MATQEFQKDTGYAYVILFSCFMLRILEVFSLVTFGIYVLEFLEYFNAKSTLSITFLGGVYALCQAVAGPGIGFLVKKFGARITVMGCVLVSMTSLLVTGSFPSRGVLTVNFVVMGICSQSFVLAGQVVVQRYFDKKRSLAAGINMSGASWGFFLWPPLARFLIDRYTWRGSYYIHAGIMAHGLVFASLLRPVPPSVLKPNHPAIVVTEESSRSKCDLKHLNWFLFALGTFLLATGHLAAPVYYPIKAHRQDVSDSKIPFLISVIGLIGIFLRPFSGFLGDMKCVNRQMLTSVSLTISGISLIVATQVSGFPALMVMAVIFGIMQSLYAGTTGAQVVDVFTLENVELGGGLFSMCFGFGICVLNPVAGLLIDLTGTTSSVFYVFGCTQILGGIIYAIVSRLTMHLNKDLPEKDHKNTQLALAISLESINI